MKAPYKIVCFLTLIAMLLSSGCSVSVDRPTLPSSRPIEMAPTKVTIPATSTGVQTIANDFSQMSLPTDEIFDFRLEKGSLRILVKQGGYSQISFLKGRSVRNGRIEVDASFVNIPPAGGDLGIAFRWTEGNHYVCSISSQGGFAVRKYDGKWTVLAEQKTSAAIKKDKDTNRLAVEFVGEEISFFANGELLVQLKDATFNQGELGLMIGGRKDGQGLEIKYENLLVQEYPVRPIQKVEVEKTKAPPTKIPPIAKDTGPKVIKEQEIPAKQLTEATKTNKDLGTVFNYAKAKGYKEPTAGKEAQLSDGSLIQGYYVGTVSGQPGVILQMVSSDKKKTKAFLGRVTQDAVFLEDSEGTIELNAKGFRRVYSRGKLIAGPGISLKKDESHFLLASFPSSRPMTAENICVTGYYDEWVACVGGPVAAIALGPVCIAAVLTVVGSAKAAAAPGSQAVLVGAAIGAVCICGLLGFGCAYVALDDPPTANLVKPIPTGKTEKVKYPGVGNKIGQITLPIYKFRVITKDDREPPPEVLPNGEIFEMRAGERLDVTVKDCAGKETVFRNVGAPITDEMLQTWEPLPEEPKQPVVGPQKVINARGTLIPVEEAQALNVSETEVILSISVESERILIFQARMRIHPVTPSCPPDDLFFEFDLVEGKYDRTSGRFSAQLEMISYGKAYTNDKVGSGYRCHANPVETKKVDSPRFPAQLVLGEYKDGKISGMIKVGWEVDAQPKDFVEIAGFILTPSQ